MISFLISLAALILGYFLYGKLVEKIFGPDPARQTPAIAKSDGVDFIAMPTWRVFLIQFLNIAGTGPIFGAIMGAKFGPAAYLWIVFGCIFAGAVHDYLSGMLSIRLGGAGLPEIVGKYLGNTTKAVMLLFTVILLILVGAVFIYSPAEILRNIAGDGSSKAFFIWACVIFAYYIIATMVPIDKLIGKIYPVFGFALIFMAISLLVCMIIKAPHIPEFWDGLGNRTQSLGGSGQAMFPFMFITIACGAISGFHATQSPLMARCIKNEKLGRPVFYGSMITEGIVALIWASISSYFFFDSGAAAVGSDLTASAPTVVTKVSISWLGVIGGILAVLGVVAAPITSGDTALRSARLIISEALHFDQKPIAKRLAISIPLFLVVALMLWYNISDADGFNTIWKYFGWANQTLSVFTLWAITVYLATAKKGIAFLITYIPACFMSAVCFTYLCIAKIGFNLPIGWNRWIGLGTFVFAAVTFAIWKYRHDKKNPITE